MSRIYVISPSGVVLAKAAFKRGIKRLRSLGHSIELDPSVLARYNRFAGDDSTRLAAITRAAQADVDVIMITRGGYGLTRLLPQLPYALIAASIARGVHWLGFSDFTALQLALLAQWPEAQELKPTWAGPSVLADFGIPDTVDDVTQDCFQDLVLGLTEGVGWRQSLAWSRQMLTCAPIEDALLWGGNLSMLTSLLGTDYFPQSKHIAGGILFLEEVNEHPYRIERMLIQLHLAGVLQTQKAIVFGQCSAYRLGTMDKARGGKGSDKGFKLDNVMLYLQDLLGIPVFTGLPFGHVPQKVCLPVGQKVNLAQEGQNGREVFLIWGHSHPHAH